MNNQEYLNSIKPGAIEGWHKYKIAPSITGAQAVLESGWGSSKLAKPPYNNNFGIKAGDDWTGRKITMSTREYVDGKWITINDDFRAYDTLSDSIADHGAFFTNTEWRKNNYREVIGQIDYKKAAISLQKAGYATDPSYSQKLINIIEQNDLQSWDQEALKGETTKIDTPQTIPISTDANITASGGKKKIVGGSISSDARNGISQFTLSVIGDSLGVGTEPFLKQYPWARQSYDNYGSRQWTHETDVYNGITALNNMKNAGNLNNNVVFILGTNRGVDASEIDEAVSICGRDRNLILVDTTSEVNHRTKVSSEYEKAASRHNNVFYANWSSYSRANIGAWYYADGANGTRIHMNPTGYQKHADFIVQAVYEANQIIFENSVKVDPIKPSTETVNIYDIEYDDGVFTSPKGDSSIYNKALNDQLGFRARKGQIMWIERKYSGSETDSASLLNAALEKMKEASVPAAQYTVNMRYLPDNISIGDTGVFIDHEFDPPLYIQARVLAMTTSESNPANNTVTIGNVVEVTPQPKSDLLSIQKELQDTREISLAEYWKVKPVTLQVTTSNGLVLKPKNNETFAQLVTKYNQEHVLKNGSLLVDMRNAKDKNATITITGSIKNNYIDSVDEIVNNINYDDYNNVNFDDGPIDVNNNPQGQDVVDINDYNNIRKLIVDSFDVEFLNVDGNVVGSEKVYVYEDSTFVSKIINPGQHINKIRILSPRDCTFDNISAIDESIKLTDTVESTSVYVKVFQKEKEVTHEFKNFKWTRVSQNTRLDNEWNDVNKWNESNNIDLDVKDVFGNESTFICRVYDDEYNFVSATSITLAVSTNGKSAYDVWIEAGNEGSEEDYLSSLKGEDGKDGMSEEEAQTIKQQVEEALTGAEQAKEKAQSAYKNAVADAKAEAERLDGERQLIIDGKFEVINQAQSTLEQSIATAEQNAQSALQKAGASEDLASAAKQASESALANIGTVKTELGEVKTQASDSLIKAQEALNATGTLSTQVKSYEETVDGYKSEVANYSRTNETLTAKVNSYEETVDGYSQSLTRVEGKIDNLSSDYTTYKNQVKSTTDEHTRRLTALDGTGGRVSKVEQKADSIQTSLSSYAKTSYVNSQITAKAGEITTNLTKIIPTNTQIQTKINESILADKKIKDTRSTNQLPSWYRANYPSQTVKEFKQTSVVGLTSTYTYAIVETQVPWANTSGGTITQIAYMNDGTTQTRRGYTDDSNWTPWVADVTRSEFQTVKETTNLYERTIGTTEANIKSNIARITMSDSLFQTEVSKNTDVSNTKSKVTQLSNSWALTLKSGNDIKTAINATTNGIRLKGSLITLDGQVNMTSSFIVPEGNIGNLSAKKITSGTIDTARLNSADIVTKGLTSNVVKSTHILADNALFDKLFTNDLATQKLATKQAWIKTGMIANAQIGTAQIGTIDASNGKIVNIDAQYITANHAKLVSAGFQGLNSNMHIDGGAIRIQNRDGDFATMNAIPEFRSQDSAGTSAILGKGRSQYYSGNQSRFYIGSSLNGDEYNGKTVHGVHISKNQTWGIYRQSDAFGGTQAQYYKTPAGWGAVQIIEELMRTGKIVNNFSQASALIRGLNGWGNSFPVLQPGDMVMYKAAVAGNSSGIERIWTMGTSSNGATRTYSHVHHVFEGGTTGVSDARLKHDIKPTDIKALDHISDLSFKQFKWNRNDALEPLGLIAQESGILRVPDEEMEGIDIQRAMMLALKGIQELSQKVQKLEEQNETLRTNNRGTSY